MSEEKRVVSRRTLLKTAGLAAGTLAITGPQVISARAGTSPAKQGLKLALMLPAEPSVRWTIAKQIGVNHAIVSVAKKVQDVPPGQFASILQKIKADLTEAGLSFAGIEGNPIKFHRVKLGLPGRDEDIHRFCEMLKAYYDAGFDGPIRPDHAPTLAGEDNDDPGYAMQGKILAIGYMKGILDALGIPSV